MSVVHIAGAEVQVEHLFRQRCSWCGALLADYDLDRIAVPIGDDGRPAMWPVGTLVAVEGDAWWPVHHEDGERLPAEACAQLDPVVTR